MMQKDTVLRTLFVLIWVIATMHFVAEWLFLYWTYRWLDIPMHFLGGAWVGLAAYWLWYRSGHFRKREGAPTKPFLIVVGGGVMFGLIWELYEFLVWMLGGAGLPFNYVPDTLLDLVMDTLGALCVYGLFRWLTHRNNNRLLV